MRADRWYCAIELIKEKPLLGYGTGTEKDVLMQKYKKYNLQNAVVNHYDAHNQYLAFAIKGGIFGLIFFIIAIGYAIYLALASRNFLYLSFITLFAIACMTENVLESNKGIFFFAFFNTLFAANALMMMHIRKNRV
jgi:O-antigen ligase